MVANKPSGEDETLRRAAAHPADEQDPTSAGDSQAAPHAGPSGLSADPGATVDYAELIFETAGALIVVLDRSGRVLALNQAACRLLGQAKPELVGQLWFDVAVPPEHRREQEAAFLSAADSRNGTSRRITGPVQSSTSQPHAIDWQVSPLNRDGKLTGCLAVGLDVTDRLADEKLLRASELRYRRLFESAKDGILILNANTGIVDDVNPFLSELLDLSYADLVGKPVWELGFLKDVAASKENFLELQRHEYIRYEDLPLETADGRRIDAEFVSNVYPVDGNLVIQCNIRNISARKKAEVALQELHEDLEQRVLDRTAELSKVNDALKGETVMRIRAEESELTAVAEERTRIAREIHDTLAQGFAGIIIQLAAADDVLTAEPSTAKNHIIKARQLAVDSLADARRSMWALRPQMLEKGDLVYAITAVIERMAKESSIQFEFQHQGQRTRLAKETEDGLMRICQEALMNAGKHSQSQVIRTVLKFADDQVELTIEDEGQGFAADSSPFLRGLGIRIMKERAAALGGTFTITSEPGKGTQVMVNVPATKCDNGG